MFVYLRCTFFVRSLYDFTWQILCAYFTHIQLVVHPAQKCAAPFFYVHLLQRVIRLERVQGYM